jgi:hypothetical protein
MAVTLTNAARTAACDAIVDLIDAGTGAGNLILYLANGTTEVATLPLNDPAFGAASNGVATLDVDPAVTDTSATGNASAATVAIFKDSNSTEVLRCSVGVGSGDIQLTNNVIAAGETVTITSLTVTVPAS